MSFGAKRRKTNEGNAVDVQAAPQKGPSNDRDHGEAVQQRRSLFVRALAADTTTDDLVEHFSQSFPIKHAVAILDPATKQCKGFGFVTFADSEDAANAKTELQGSTLHGRKIHIDIAEPRQRNEETGKTEKAKHAHGKPEQAEQERKPNEVIMRNLPWSIKSQEQIVDLVKSLGKPTRINLPTKPGSKLLRGFAIVRFQKHTSAAKAIQTLNGKSVDGRPIAVDWSVDKSTYQKTQDGEEAKTDGDDATQESLSSAEEEGSDADGGVELPADDDDASSEGEEDSEPEDFEEDVDQDEDMEDAEQQKAKHEEDNGGTLFVRNLPFSANEDSLEEHFSQFGDVRYAKVVVDHNTMMPRGTGFVNFFNPEDAAACVKGAPKAQKPQQGNPVKPGESVSVLQDENQDSSGRYTMDGRILQVSRAVSRNEAERLREEGVANRFNRDKDKRRLYLLNEGTISTDSPLYQHLSPAEKTLREQSLKQRKSLLEKNPTLHLSLTRLSIRNIPRNITSKDLKDLAREAVVEFATNVKEGLRQPLSKEEIVRGGEEMKQAEHERKRTKKGIVKQAKVVFESREGRKVEESTGAGRSRGYGFIEYHTHRNALMGLRWLNGHEIRYDAQENPRKRLPPEMASDRKKKLVAEFALENVQVVNRRKDRELKHKHHAPEGPGASAEIEDENAANQPQERPNTKRKRDAESDLQAPETPSSKKDRKAASGGRSTQPGSAHKKHKGTQNASQTQDPASAKAGRKDKARGKKSGKSSKKALHKQRKITQSEQ